MIPGFPQPLAMSRKIKFIGVSADARSFSPYSSPGFPSGAAAGDLLIALIMSATASRTVTPPSGWTAFSPQPSGSKNSVYSFWKISDGTETGAKFAISGSSGVSFGVMLAYRNGRSVAAIGPISEPSGATPTALSMTADKGKLLAVFARTDTISVLTPPPAMIERFVPTSQSPSLCIYDEDWAGGVSGDRSISLSSSRETLSFLISVV